LRLRGQRGREGEHECVVSFHGLRSFSGSWMNKCNESFCEPHDYSVYCELLNHIQLQLRNT
jgi:hypothetical protein